MNAITSKNLTIIVIMNNSNRNTLFRYRILGNIDKYQPDIVISATTAVLVMHEQEKFEETRLRISLASLKFTTCWVYWPLEG
jgi:G:T-mismatch repair DNA endonuclease (very short patch repair protein)